MIHIRSIAVLTVAALVFLCVASGAGPWSATARADSADPNGPECMCRFQGQRYHLGELACINSKLARCDMFLNNTSWTIIEDICPSASLSPVQNGFMILPASFNPVPLSRN